MKLMPRLPKRLVAVAAVIGGLAAISAADYYYWTQDVYVHPSTGYDSFFHGANFSTTISGSGYIYVHFVTAATNSFGNPRVRVKVTDTNTGATRWNQTYLAYYNQNQRYDIQIPAGTGPHNVSLYGVCDEAASGPTQVVLGYTETDY